MENKVWKYMGKHHMVEDGDRILLGVSGGADSVALFYLLLAYQKKVPFDMCVVHVNHMLRGEEAERDAEFVRKLCEKQQVKFVEYTIDVKALATEQKLSVEEAGRQAREDAFQKQLDKWKGTKIALAHHKNDQAETILHHLSRGTGIRGLCGMFPVQGEKIRPLLCLEREEIEQYLIEQQIPWVTDSSNEHEDYTRNRIRHQVLPILTEQVNAQAVSHIAQAGEYLQEIDGYLKRQSGKLLEQSMERTPKGYALRDSFFFEDEVLQKYGLQEFLAIACGSKKDITGYHIEQVIELHKKEVGKQVDLPGIYFVVRSYDGIVVSKKETKRESETCHELPIEGQLEIGDGEIGTRLFSYDHEIIPEKTYTKWINYDKMVTVPQVRTRQSGDYIVVDSSGGRKKIKDYFIDCKIPRQERDQILMVACDSEIIWIIGYRISEAYKVCDDTKQVLEITYKGGK